MKRMVLTAGGVLLVALAAVLVLGELGLRLAGFRSPIWYRPDAQLGWALRSGTQGWFTKEGGAYVEINAAGFRDRPHALAKPRDTYRIAVLGDSVVEAFQVETKATFWWQLQEKLRPCPGLQGRKVEAIAFGVAGYGTVQEALLLESGVMAYRPDLVLLAFAPNDVLNNSPRLEPEKTRPFFLLDGDGLRLDASFTGMGDFARRSSALFDAYRTASDWMRLAQLVQAARNGLETWRQAGSAHAKVPGTAGALPGIEPTTNTGIFTAPRDPNWESAWTITERLIARMARFSAQNDARFAVAVLSHSAQVHPDPTMRRNLQDALGVQDLFYIERRLEAFGKSEDVPVIPLASELARRAEAGNIHFHGFKNYRMGWGHWNEDGHRSAAEILAQSLCPRL